MDHCNKKLEQNKTCLYSKTSKNFKSAKFFLNIIQNKRQQNLKIRKLEVLNRKCSAQGFASTKQRYAKENGYHGTVGKALLILQSVTLKEILIIYTLSSLWVFLDLQFRFFSNEIGFYTISYYNLQGINQLIPANLCTLEKTERFTISESKIAIDFYFIQNIRVGEDDSILQNS